MNDTRTGWVSSKVKYLGRYINGYPFKPKDWSDRGKPIIRIQNLSNPNAEPNYYEGDLPNSLHVVKGDILISWSASLGAYEWQGEDAWLNQHIFKVDLNEDIVCKPYFRWLAEWFMGELNSEAHGSTMQHVTKDRFGSFRVLLPHIENQPKIADYLNSEIAQIDNLIEEKERMLALLEEKRAALISRAVTRGLDPNAPPKPSGHPWLGDIPADWKVRRCASLFKEIDERNEPELPLLNVSLNTGVTLRIFSDNKIESVAADFATYKVARKGNLVFNKMRFWQGAVGIAPEDGLASPDYTVAEFGPELNADYIEFLFRIPQFIMEVRRHSHGIVDDRLRLYWDGFKNIYIPVPPLSEQKTIAANLAAERDKTYDLETKLNKSITLLKERRSALITAAVTGRIEIPEISPEKEVRYAN